MLRTVPLSIIRSFSLYTQQWFMSYRFADSLRAGSGRSIQVCWQLASSQAVSKTVWHIPLLCVKWKTPDDGQMNCPKHVEFYFKYIFEKLVLLVSFIIRIYHDARSPESRMCERAIQYDDIIKCRHITTFCIPPPTPVVYLMIRNPRLFVGDGGAWVFY